MVRFVNPGFGKRIHGRIHLGRLSIRNHLRPQYWPPFGVKGMSEGIKRDTIKRFPEDRKEAREAPKGSL